MKLRLYIFLWFFFLSRFYRVNKKKSVVYKRTLTLELEPLRRLRRSQRSIITYTISARNDGLIRRYTLATLNAERSLALEAAIIMND